MRLLLLITLTFLYGGILHAQTVYKTPSGKKYHTGVCRTVKNVSEKMTRAQAISAGLTPCSICEPDKQVSQQPLKNSNYKDLGIKPGEAKGELKEAVQCKGTTKEGKRCSHRTKNVNGYCFQHEPKG